jgi:hypothetical protein
MHISANQGVAVVGLMHINTKDLVRIMRGLARRRPLVLSYVRAGGCL